ncbi:MAG: hypothetical protein ACYTG0_33035 [Planctomycetota bacterium]|jgi:hypothetical protein
MAVTKSHGFGSVDQVSAFFSIPKSEVRRKGVSGEWPSYVISGQRVFDIDAIIELLVKADKHGTENQKRGQQ